MSEEAGRFARALGSSRVVPLAGLPSGGPLDLLQLRASVARLRAEGTVDCRLPISSNSWRELEELAADLRSEGQVVTAAELARALLERGVDALRLSRKRSG